MNEPQRAARKPRKWLRWLRRLAVVFAVLLVGLTMLGFYLYHNLTGVIVWFANRSHPGLLLELQHAGFTGGHSIEFQNISLKPGVGKDPVLVIEKAEVDFKWSDLKNHRIGSIRVENPRVSVTDALLNQPAKKAAAEMPLTSADGLWLVDDFNVTGGTAEIDLSHSPLIRFGFASDLREIYLSSEIRFSTQSQTLNITGIEFSSRDPKPVKFGTIKSIAVNFSLDHIAQNKIDGLAIATPSLLLGPKLLESFGPAGESTSNATAPAIPWTLGKLQLTDGELFVKGFGNKIPETSMKFSVDEQDLQLGANADGSAEKTHKLEIWDIRAAAAFARLEPFLLVGSVEVGFTGGGLLDRRELDSVTITGMDFKMGQTFRSLMAAVDQNDGAAAPATPAADESSPWVIRNLHVYNGRATIADLGAELPDIGFNLDTEMNNVALSDEIRHADTQIQEVVIKDLIIPSPHDPFVPVLNFATIRLRFSLAQILDQQIDQVIVEKPSIFVGKQLFWYFDEIKQRQAAAPVVAPQTPPSPATQNKWGINKLSVTEGSLVVANAGKAGVTMPFKFSTEASNLHFNNPSDLQLKVKLVIDKGDYQFPAYQLLFKQLWGSIDFGLPVGTNARNVVQTLQAAGATWKQFDARQLWFFVTYDSDGIYGKFGGAAYHGYINGGFDFYMLEDTPWGGWVSGSKLDLAQITDILAPQNFQISGPADFEVEVNGLNHEVQRLVGTVRTKGGGKMKINKLDQIITSMPSSWSSIKRGTTRIVLETLRDFDYTGGNVDFWYAAKQGNLTLKMQGPRGSRNFDIDLHSE